VYEIHVDLTSFTPFCIFYRVGNHCWQVIAKSLQSVLKLQTWLMGATYAVMGFFKCFLYLWTG